MSRSGAVLSALGLEQYLVEKGTLSPEAALRARASVAETGQGFASVIVNLGLISAGDVADGLSNVAGIERAEPSAFPEQAVELVNANPIYFRRNNICPLALEEGHLSLAMADPTDAKVINQLAFAFEVEVRPLVAALSEIEEAVERLYFAEASDAAVDGGGELWGANEVLDDDTRRLEELASDAPVIKYVNRMIARAAEAGASDIHFESSERDFRVRFRVDGMLEDIDRPGRAMAAGIASRVKILSGLNIAERRLAQDGRFRDSINGRELDFRVSTTPAAFGESVVLRILDRAGLPGDFGSLGFADDDIAVLDAAIRKPDGILLVTGPTGSGKTTTLYSALQLLNQPSRKILTVEDPIEYVLEGINQVQVDAKIGRTFAASLRSFLRQDPDVLMVGEIRDAETAEIAVQASLTGHLVLSTLHTNTAAGALTRLLDMGIDDYLIASTVTLIVGQRLVRRLCAECCLPGVPDPALMDRFEIGAENRAGFARAQGCASCGGSGYQGRRAITEVLPVSEDIRHLITAHADASTIEAAAVKAGMTPMIKRGIQMATRGATSIEEVLRVTRERS